MKRCRAGVGGADRSGVTEGGGEMRAAVAWKVNCPPGHEFDYLVFANEDEALSAADAFNDDCEEGDPTWPVPLYELEPSASGEGGEA